MFGNQHVFASRKFMNDKAAVRVWYNAKLDSADGSALTTEAVAFKSGGMSASGTQSTASNAIDGIPNNTHAGATRLGYNEVRDISSAIVIVDAGRVIGANSGQLAAYVGLVSLAQVHLNAEVGDVPTILHLFAAPTKAPALGLSNWDQAFLKALYHTEQTDPMQLSEIKASVVRDIAR